MIPTPVIELALVPPDSPILRTPCREVSSEEMRELSEPKSVYRIDKFRRQQGGVGLAAPQIGDGRQWFIWQETSYPRGEMVFNPKVGFRMNQTESKPEGCLSFPGRTVDVTRSVEIDVEYTNDLGVFRQRRLHYRAARIFLHEFDHLQGVCIL